MCERELWQEGNRFDCDVITVRADEVIFYENATMADDHVDTNENCSLSVDAWRRILQELDSGQLSVSDGAVTLTRLSTGEIRVEWLKNRTSDSRAFPIGRRGLLVIPREKLSV